MIKKIRHLLESSRHSVIIQTDHSAILNILKQKFVVAITSIMRMNLRLVRASQFLSQFSLDVRHKSDKEHIISNALSRLTSVNKETSTNISDYDELSKVDALYTATLVEMSNDFRQKLLKEYKDDS